MNALITMVAIAACLYFGVVYHVPYLTGLGTFGAVIFVLNMLDKTDGGETE